MKRSMKAQIVGTVMAGAIVATAQAGPGPFNTLFFDINDITVSITDVAGAATTLTAGGGDELGGAGTPFSGTMTFSDDGFSYFASVTGDNSANGRFHTGMGFAGWPSFLQSPAGSGDPIDPAGFGTLTGVITFSAGTVTGTFFEFFNDIGDKFHTAIPAGPPGSLAYDGSAGTYIVGGLTLSGFFTDVGGDSKFGPALDGVDISKFLTAGSFGASGEFSDFRIAAGPGTSFQTGIQMEIIFAIPLPGGAAMASIGFLGVVVRRRRG